MKVTLPFLVIVPLLFAVTASADIEISSVKGNVDLIRKQDTRQAKHRMSVHEGDAIITNEGETADVRWGSLWACRVLPESHIVLLKAALKNQQVEIKKGSMLFRFRDLPDEVDFALEAPVSVSAVRGTTFMVTTLWGKDTYALHEGSIQISAKNSDNQFLLLPGKAISVNKNGSMGEPRDINETEKGLLLEAKKLKIKPKRKKGSYL